MTDVLPSKEKFDYYVKIGLVERREHSTLPISIYCYSIFTNYERLWNRVTMNSRGIAFDEKGRCIIRCMTKFFNDVEPHALCDIDKTQKPVYFNKLDGSLIQVVNDHEYGLLVSTKGSFNSKQAAWASNIIGEEFEQEDFASGKTYVFELIHPDNRIVLDYGKERSLHLLAVIDIDTGKESDILSPEFDMFNKAEIVEDIDEHLAKNSIEGVVVKTGEHRYKVKSGEYLRLHRIVTEFTPKAVWNALATGQSVEFENMPEEFQTWLDTTVEEIQSSYDEKYAEIVAEHESTKDLSDKELGLLDDIKYKGLIFHLRNGKDISEKVWRLVKPREKVEDERIS